MEQENQLEQIVLQADAEQGAYRKGYKDGFTHAQQSQPMWREIEGGKEYRDVLVKSDDYNDYYYNTDGERLILDGYTHYLASEDLLKLPVEKK